MSRRPVRRAAVPGAAIAVLLFGAVEGLYLFWLGSALQSATPPFAFERIWFGRRGLLSLQLTLMLGNIAIVLLLWGFARLRRRRGERALSYLAPAVGLLALQCYCYAISSRAPRVSVTLIETAVSAGESSGDPDRSKGDHGDDLPLPQVP